MMEYEEKKRLYDIELFLCRHSVDLLKIVKLLEKAV